jgi:hypothetical protein
VLFLIVRRIRISIMLTRDPSRRAPPLRFDRSSRVMHRRVASARCSATRIVSSLRGLAGRWVLPSSISPGGAHGVLPFAGLLPHRVADHL